MKYILVLLFIGIASQTFSQDLSRISENDTIFLVLPQSYDLKEVHLDFVDFKLSYMGTKDYGINQYSFYDQSGNGRISMNTQDDSPSASVIKRNIVVEAKAFLQSHQNSIITLKSIAQYGYRKLFYDTLKVQDRKRHMYYVINESDLQKKTITLRLTNPYSFE